MKDNKSLFGAHILLISVYIIVIFILSVIPKPGNIDIFSYNKFMYFLHFIEFGILAFLVFITFLHYNNDNPYLSTFYVVIAIAILSEIAQLFVSYRGFNPLDIAADGIGALTALTIIGFKK